MSQVQVDFQPVSVEQIKKKYFLRDKENEPMESSMSEVNWRVANAIAGVDIAMNSYRDGLVDEYRETLELGAIAGGRIMSNAGAIDVRGAVALINCIGSGKIEDSMDSIFHRMHQAAMLLKAGCGIGYCFSPLRPEGSAVGGAGAMTNGPLAFAKVFDTMCETVSSAGGRRGAQMLTFMVSHPDVMKVISAKQKDGMLRFFNLSILIPDSFMDSVRSGGMWSLQFEGKVHDVVAANSIWDSIMINTYESSEPGVIFIDTINRMNNNWWCEDIDTTNPCGEQPLPPFGACLLGSNNLVKFVHNPFTPEAYFDMDGFRKVVRTFTRMLDNVVEIANLPLQEFTDELNLKRRHGMGYLGLGSAMAMLGQNYGSLESVIFTDEVTKVMCYENYRAGAWLAEEKGEAPILTHTFEITDEMIQKNTNLRDAVNRGERYVGEKVSGRTLWLLSRFFDAFHGDDEGREILGLLHEKGCRFTHATSLAPTGTIALAIANNVTNGVEPSFAHFYFRNITRDDRATREQQPVFSYEFLAFRKWYMDNFPNECPVEPDYFISSKLTPEQAVVVGDTFKAWEKLLPYAFKSSADGITPEQHIAVQAAAQKWIDSSISKTINVPTDISFDDFKGIYALAHKSGLKGCTTYRYNPKVTQGILVRPEDLERNVYRFHLQDGSVVESKGNEEIEYMGNIHVAANLFEALKEGKL
jgi:ribonucleoside-diphosphate reductase alpha chain